MVIISGTTGLVTVIISGIDIPAPWSTIGEPYQVVSILYVFKKSFALAMMASLDSRLLAVKVLIDSHPFALQTGCGHVS